MANVFDESGGKPAAGIENVEVACGTPTLMQGYNSEDISEGIDEWVTPTPLGVFGIIAPSISLDDPPLVGPLRGSHRQLCGDQTSPEVPSARTNW